VCLVGPKVGEVLEFRPFKIGKYLLLERIATGGMAEVYRAKASGAGGFEKQLAIKRILPTYSENEEFRKMFEYEARLSSQLTHANIVQVYDFVKSGETYLLAMEYVNGKNLRQFLNKAKKMGTSVPIEFAVYVINEVCKGLEYAHSKRDENTGKALNIIHRDMSPQNVMLSYEGSVKIVDFGIAKAKDRVDETRSGVIKGKFGYMSPEQANGDSVDNKTDIFSTGIILFELLTGRRLFAAETDLATLRLIQECVIPSPGRINPKVGSDLEKVLLMALAKDLNVRYSNAGDLHRSLLEYQNKHCPTYTQREVSHLIEKVFADEIEIEKKRFEQLLRQSIPFSQGAAPPKTDMTDVESALEGTQTRSDIIEDEPITISGADGEAVAPDSPVDSNLGDWVQRPEGGTSAYSLQSNEPQNDEEVSLNDRPAASDSTSIKDEHRFTQTHQLGSMDGEEPGPPEPATSSKGPELSYPTEFNPKKMGSYSELNRLSKNDATQLKTQTDAQRGDRDTSVSLSRAPESRSSAPKFQKREGLFDEPAYGPKKRKRGAFPPALTLGMAVFVTFYAYRIFFDGGFRNFLESQDLRGPTQSSQEVEPLVDATRKPVGECSIKVESDPPGADVYLDNESRGITPATLTGYCNRALVLSLRLSGYEVLTESLVLRNPYNEYYRNLKRIPVGTLELMVDRNADVYINGQKIGTADANKMFERTLRANETYTVRLINSTFGLQTQFKIDITEGKVSHRDIRLEESGMRNASPRRTK
jgi:serine/threonine protein kinase